MPVNSRSTWNVSLATSRRSRSSALNQLRFLLRVMAKEEPEASLRRVRRVLRDAEDRFIE